MTADVSATPPARLLGNVYATRQGLFCVDPRDQFVGRMLVEDGQFGVDELALLRLFVGEQSRVLLLGAHIGALAIPLARCVREVVALEANPDTFHLFEVNIALNRIGNVRAFNIAANDEGGRLEFVLNTVNSGGSKRMPRERDADYFADNPEIRAVPAARLDDLLVGQHFDLIFMDIEGSEYFAMRGMPGLIAGAEVVVAEFLPPCLTRVAGVTVDQFLSPLADFETMVVPSLRRTVHGTEAMRATLEGMIQGWQGDNGLIFHRRHIVINFQ